MIFLSNLNAPKLFIISLNSPNDFAELIFDNVSASVTSTDEPTDNPMCPSDIDITLIIAIIITTPITI